ncbi:unnamed protein product [Cuscuta campestris]|uniref:Auxin efflux carrier component n=1 Tax=Cuscuta campestris TaxID=132261 RepID=A0A484KVD7_9ASTE|nr:unnamed protein product [Cuscuta campestris]
MISLLDFYHVMTAMVPLYVAMLLAYGSVKWWKIFTPDQCSGINRFVALFDVPLLSFHFIAENDPYTMNLRRFIAADTLQKLIVLGALAVWANFSKRGSLEWSITLFSLSTLPNTLGRQDADFGASDDVFGPTPRPSNHEDESTKARSHFYPAPNPGMFSPSNKGANNQVITKKPNNNHAQLLKGGGEEGGKEVHMFVWSSSGSPVSDVFGGRNNHGIALDQPANKEVRVHISPTKGNKKIEGIDYKEMMKNKDAEMNNNDRIVGGGEVVEEWKVKGSPGLQQV